MGRPISLLQIHRKNNLNAEQISQNNFGLLAEDIRCPEKQPIVFEGREKIFFFLFFFFFSYFLLKSSVAPLLLLNFHFHYTITLQKKERERSPIFKPNFIYISKFFLFFFLILYFKESNLYARFLIFVFQYVI